MLMRRNVAIRMAGVKEHDHSRVFPHVIVVATKEDVKAFDTSELSLNILHTWESRTLIAPISHNLLASLES